MDDEFMEQSTRAKTVLSSKVNGAFQSKPKPLLGKVQEHVDMVGSEMCMIWFV